MDSLLGGQMFAPIFPSGRLHAPIDAPIVREVVEDWLRQRGGHLRVAQFLAANDQRVDLSGATPSCLGQ
jgi:hypothetical protein